MKKWCALCGEELKFDSAQGWVHQDEKEGDERCYCYCPTSTTRDWKAAERREEAEKDTSTLLGKFNVAVGCLEDAICYLGQVNEQYEEHIDDVRLVTEYGLRPCNPAVDFWLQADLAEGALKVILDKLQRVESLVPKEVAP